MTAPVRRNALKGCVCGRSEHEEPRRLDSWRRTRKGRSSSGQVHRAVPLEIWMNKSRILHTLAVLAVVAVVLVALYQVDLPGMPRRLHGQA